MECSAQHQEKGKRLAGGMQEIKLPDNRDPNPLAAAASSRLLLRLVLIAQGYCHMVTRYCSNRPGICKCLYIDVAASAILTAGSLSMFKTEKNDSAPSFTFQSVSVSCCCGGVTRFIVISGRPRVWVSNFLLS